MSITGTPAHQRMPRAFGRIAQDQGLCGCHVHVAIADREQALRRQQFPAPLAALLLP